MGGDWTMEGRERTRRRARACLVATRLVETLGAIAGETEQLVAGWAERGIFGWADLARSRPEMRGVVSSVRLRADACGPP